MIHTLHDSLTSLFEDNPDPCYMVDREGRFVACNDATVKLIGYTRDELLQMSFHPLVTKDKLNLMVQIFMRVLQEGEKADFEVSIYNKAGELLELSITAVPVKIEGQNAGIIGIAKDMTKRKNLERTLVKTQVQLNNIFDSIELCLWSIDLLTGEIQISMACEAIYGYSQEAFRQDPEIWHKVIHAEDRLEVTLRQAELTRGNKIKHQYRILRADGTERWVSDYTVPVIDHTGRLVRLDGVITDITENKKSEERLHFLAFHDSLTGLPNRRHIREKLRTILARAEKLQHKAAVLFLDLDGFKLINDSLGHATGDRLLQRVAKRLRRSLGERKHMARIGGDEFVILVEDVTDLRQVEETALTILKVIASPFRLLKQELHISTSIGISLYPDHGHGHESLFKRADQAMYLAKEKGKNTYQIYNESLSAKMDRQFILKQGLQKALDNNELLVLYQPIYNTETGRVIGTEALLRWEHSSGNVSPNEFIPIAEESGFIVSIGEWVLRNACSQTKRWQDNGHKELYVSVNMSARQLEQEELIQTIRRILVQTGLRAQSLHIEITESTAMTNVNRALHMLQALGELGISISIDDFGTGYSSLSYLQKFPIHTIKIDQAFIRTKQWAIIRAIIAMAGSLNLHVIAEGIESKEEVHQLKELGCTHMQGFLFSRPVSEDQLEALLGTSR